MVRQGSVVRSTMYLASMDIKKAFDEAKPRQLAQNHDTHMANCSPLARGVGA